MGKKLYVGGLPYATTQDALNDLFSQAGTVESAMIIIDKMTGRSKGFGFVEMASDEDAEKAIDMFNGKDFEGRSLTVNVARPMEERAPRREGGGGGFGGGHFCAARGDAGLELDGLARIEPEQLTRGSIMRAGGMRLRGAVMMMGSRSSLRSTVSPPERPGWGGAGGKKNTAKQLKAQAPRVGG